MTNVSICPSSSICTTLSRLGLPPDLSRPGGVQYSVWQGKQNCHPWAGRCLKLVSDYMARVRVGVGFSPFDLQICRKWRKLWTCLKDAHGESIRFTSSSTTSDGLAHSMTSHMCSYLLTHTKKTEFRGNPHHVAEWNVKDGRERRVGGRRVSKSDQGSAPSHLNPIFPLNLRCEDIHTHVCVRV